MQKILKNGPYILIICFILSGCCVIDDSLSPEFRPCCHCTVCETETPDGEIPLIEEKLPIPKPELRGNPKKYAVLISAYEVNNQDSDGDGIRDGENVKHHAAFWYDLVLQYKMLIERGFDHNNIKVLYGRGSAFDTIYPEYDLRKLYPTHQITYHAVTKDNIERIFNELKVTTDDHVYIWWMGHGRSISGPDNCDLSLFIGFTDENNPNITDQQLHEYINRIPTCLERTIVVMACHSGGIIDDMDVAGEGTIGGGTITLVSAACEQNSYDTSSSCDVYHAEFNYTLTTALLKEDPCRRSIVSCGSDHPLDGNGDGNISLEEAHEFNKCEMRRSTPRRGDPDGIRYWRF